ncbi:putative binding-protein-dependent transport system protein [Altererythrobacter epoxidivorans]|uniref:Putative binding-protein-dependent transport system protein n=1 Tax=Altererythrobacter epoxidivorans TaxID=361183 RepID=A0A0M4MXY8_9SPHN|nr:O-antigen ligase family protein [Altererythrobacter epoxidivorans]ALE17888.1 putative binding-protein-dependent transport system protein [Altererythrobacter epoxidivorans]
MRVFKSDAMPGLTYGWIVMAVLGAAVAFLGGSSRVDVVQLIALRPLAFLLLIPALYLATSERLRPGRTPIMLMVALMALMTLQLLPLPPAVWQSLPGRETIAEFEKVAGLGENWRPLSLVPGRTLNTLMSLAIPFCALIAALSSGFRSVTILAAIAIVGVVDASLGILQVASGGTGALYYYAVTNEGTPVGIFANQNHSAVFSALCMMILVQIGTSGEHGLRGAGAKTVIGALYVLVLIAALLSGSRAGFLLTMLAVLFTIFTLWQAIAGSSSAARPRLLRKLPAPSARLLLGFVVLSLASVIAAFAVMGSAPAAGSFAETANFDDMRVRIFPVLVEMLSVFWLPGSGFGSFEEVYHMFEPAELLSPYYINQAHNDWLQFAIEGGIAGIVWLAVALAWLLKAVWAMRNHGDGALRHTVFWLAIIATIVLASAVDYPLRTPIFQLVLGWLAAALVVQKARYRVRA